MAETEVFVLRLGHRPARDPRLTTHCCLVARAFGAKEIIIAGEKDKSVEESVKSAVRVWGGKFRTRFVENWKNELKKFGKKGTIVHLTMYGEPLEKVKGLGEEKKIMLVVGAGKVPREVYGLSDLNVAVTHQPHSEAAALAVFLHELFRGKGLKKRFLGAKRRIVPQKKGKKSTKKG